MWLDRGEMDRAPDEVAQTWDQYYNFVSTFGGKMEEKIFAIFLIKRQTIYT
jgi:hypothetical protein